MSDQAVLEPESPYRRPTPRSSNRNIPNLYWKKAQHERDPGWVIVGPGLETRQADFWRERGRTPLVEYSWTDRVSPKTGQREPIEHAEDQLDRYRYFWLFKNGGAKEFPIDQIVAHNWHVKPPYGLSVDVFPQLKEWEIPDPLWCPVCPPTAPNKNSPAQLVQHAMISHKLQLPEAKALLEDARTPPQAGGLAPVLRRKGEMTKAAVAERKAFAEKAAAEVGDVAPTMGQMQICNSCGEQIEGKLADHNCT